MTKPNIDDYQKSKGIFINNHMMNQYKTELSKYRKAMRVIKKEKLKDEVINMVKSNIYEYKDFTITLARIGLDSYTIKDLESFL